MACYFYQQRDYNEWMSTYNVFEKWRQEARTVKQDLKIYYTIATYYA